MKPKSNTPRADLESECNTCAWNNRSDCEHPCILCVYNVRAYDNRHDEGYGNHREAINIFDGREN